MAGVCGGSALDKLETEREERLEISAVARRQPRTGGDGRPGDHGIDTQVTLATSVVEEPGGLMSLPFVEGNDLRQKGPDGRFLWSGQRPANEFIPKRASR